MLRYRSFKVEINPTNEQKQAIARHQGTVRFVYNLYLDENQKRYALEKAQAEKEQRKPKGKLMKPKDFYTWLKKEYIPQSGNNWINECPSKAVRSAIDNAYGAYCKFFKGQCGFPKFKKKNSLHGCKVYFCRNGKDAQPILSTRHYVQIPKLGRVHLKEKGYIPSYEKGRASIVKGHYCCERGRWYLSVLVEYPNCVVAGYHKNENGLGIDLGLKELAILSDGTKIENINKKCPMKRRKKKHRHLQRVVSRKLESYKKRKKELPRGEYPSRKKLDRAIAALTACQRKINGARQAHRRKSVALIMNKYPSFVTMEDLNVSGLMKNRRLARSIGEAQWYLFRKDVEFACAKRKVEFRLADRFYASSKTCHECGHVHKGLKLSDRTFVCPVCGHTEDRDVQAAQNLRDTKNYRVLELETEMF